MFRPHRYFALGLLAVVPLVYGAPPQAKDAKPDALAQKDRRVEPTSWGNVFGRVYDAETGAPIQGATVVVQNEGQFAEKGQTVAKTDKLGGYRSRGVLGRISHNLDIGRALLSSPIGILFGTATNTTKRIDVARLNLRVTAPGYKPMELPVKAISQNAGAFRIDMEPVLLVPEGKEGLSTPAGGWGAVRLDSVQLDPPVVKPGEKVALRAWVRTFGPEPGKTIEVHAASDLWRGDKKLKFRSVDADGLALFEGDFGIGRKEKSRPEVVGFVITKSTLDTSPVDAPVPAVLTIARDEAETTDGHARRAVIADILAARMTDASQKIAPLTARPTPNEFDLWLGGITHEAAGDYAASVEARTALVTRSAKPDHDRIADLARVLHRAGRDAEIPALVESSLSKVGDRDEPRLVPAATMGYLGIAYVKLGRLEQAGKLNERLLKWPYGGLDPAVVEFRNSLRLAEVESALKASPESSLAHSDYGRVLLDMGRYEEAVGELQAALRLDPASTAAKRDLVWAAMHLQEAPKETPSLDEAIAASEAALNLEKGKQRSKDFFSWHQYALLLYSKADTLRRASDPAHGEALDRSIGAFREALSLGRVGGRTNAGYYNYYSGQYLSGSEVAISGFAYPQANSCFVLLESLKALRANADDPLALLGLSGALVELGQPTLARDAVTRLRTLRPDLVEAIYLEALLASTTGQPDLAREHLEAVLKANPRHPRANRLLADLLSKEGDVAGAAQALAAHAKYYGGRLAVK